MLVFQELSTYLRNQIWLTFNRCFAKYIQKWEYFCLIITTQNRTSRCSIHNRWAFLLKQLAWTHHQSRTALQKRRRSSHRRTRWAFPCISLHGDTTSHSCHNGLDNLAALRESLWLFLPDPGPPRSIAVTECIPKSLSVLWPSHLKGKYCKCKHVPRCFIQAFNTKQTWGLRPKNNDHGVTQKGKK